MATDPSKRHLHIIAASLALSLLVAGCATDSQSGDEGILVVATTSILGDIATSVVGEEGTVEVLIPIGGDSHDFSPSAQQTARLAEADLVVANGLNLEESMVDVLESAEADGAVVIELAPLVDPIPFTEPESHEDEEHEGEEHEEVEEEHEEDAAHEHGAEDPHFWNDPIRVGDAALALAAELTAGHPDGGWQERALAYAEDMEETDAEIRGLVAPLPDEARKLVTNHEAFGYFANRYGFEIIGVVIPGGSTLAAPSSAELAELVAVMEHEGVGIIFAETSQPTTLADAVAAELGEEVQVVELFTESLGPSGSGAETLLEMLLTNAERIAAAFG